MCDPMYPQPPVTRMQGPVDAMVFFFVVIELLVVPIELTQRFVESEMTIGPSSLEILRENDSTTSQK